MARVSHGCNVERRVMSCFALDWRPAARDDDCLHPRVEQKGRESFAGVCSQCRIERFSGSLKDHAMGRQRIIVGITGATGVVYGVRALQMLRELDIETHLVVTRAGELTRAHETGLTRQELTAMADVVHSVANVAAPISSGSFETLGMLVAPCSMRSLAEIANGLTTSLLTRAADVVLKERRRLVMLVRETPLHLGHLRNMVAVTEMGAIVMPPVPAFYIRPTSIAELVDHTVARALDSFGLRVPNLLRWGEGIRIDTARHHGEPDDSRDMEFQLGDGDSR